MLYFLPICLYLGSACWVTAPFHQDTSTLALRPRRWTTWQYHQSYGASSATQVSFSMPPVTNTLFTIMSRQSRAFLDWLVVSLKVGWEVFGHIFPLSLRKMDFAFLGSSIVHEDSLSVSLPSLSSAFSSNSTPLCFYISGFTLSRLPCSVVCEKLPPFENRAEQITF